jgi:hypothetical protein
MNDKVVYVTQSKPILDIVFDIKHFCNDNETLIEALQLLNRAISESDNINYISKEMEYLIYFTIIFRNK